MTIKKNKTKPRPFPYMTIRTSTKINVFIVITNFLRYKVFWLFSLKDLKKMLVTYVQECRGENWL